MRFGVVAFFWWWPVSLEGGRKLCKVLGQKPTGPLGCGVQSWHGLHELAGEVCCATPRSTPVPSWSAAAKTPTNLGAWWMRGPRRLARLGGKKPEKIPCVLPSTGRLGFERHGLVWVGDAIRGMAGPQHPWASGGLVGVAVSNPELVWEAYVHPDKEV